MPKTIAGAFLSIAKLSSGNVKLWPWFLIARRDASDNPGQPKYLTQKVNVCPSHSNSLEEIQIADKDAATYGYALFFVQQNSASLAVFKNAAFQSTTLLPSGTVFQWQKLVRLPTPVSGTIMLADSSRPLAGPPFFGSAVPESVPAFSDQGNGPFATGRIYTLHGSRPWRANVAFYDGHCESMTGPEMRNRTASRIKMIWDEKRSNVSFP
jgi:prepilin-type processing-associated H-X9-DG protein